MNSATEINQQLFVHVVYDLKCFGMGLVFSERGELLHALSSDKVEQIRKPTESAIAHNGVRYRIVDPQRCTNFSEPVINEAIDRFNLYFLRLFGKGSFISDSYPLFGDEIEKVLARFVRNSSTIVDFGCGHKSYEPLLKKYAKNVISIDIGIPSCIQTQNEMTNKTPDLNTNVPPNTADLILCVFVLEHAANPTEVLAKITELLKSGGRLILAIPSLGFMETLRIFLLHRETTLPLNHMRAFSIISSGFYKSISSITKFLNQAGFKTIQLCGINVFRPTNPFFKKLNSYIKCLFPFKYLGAQTIIVAEKK